MVDFVKEYFDDLKRILVGIFFPIHARLFTFTFTHSPINIPSSLLFICSSFIITKL
jgi:hypothetical protein